MTPAAAIDPAPLVALRGVGKDFPNGTRALAGLDLEVQFGEFVALLGPSGCGKSTALRLIAGLSGPTDGAVEWSSTAMPSQHASRIGFVFQEPTLMPWASVFDNVALPFALKGALGPPAKEGVEAALDRVGLAAFRDAYPRELSGGMRMRVSIARALVTEPQLLLMDEPFAALDAQNRAILQAELVRIWEETGKTVVYITHSIEEALLLGDRTVVMTAQPGRIKEIIDVPFPHPRNLMALSASPEFGRLKLDIWRLLEDEVNRARAELER
jgi:NitT/TauT family transport system ATP-binding protein